MSEDELLHAVEVDELYHPVSLDAPRATGEAEGMVSSWAALGAADPEYAAIDLRETLASALARLELREQEIIRQRFLDEATQSEVAGRLGISQMHVSRLERRALQRLRGMLS